VALSTLLGLDDEPGELAGHGPITAAVARRIAAEGTWRRLLTDPVTGQLVAMGSERYEPPQEMRDAVIARDKTCRGPAAGCRPTAATSTTGCRTRTGAPSRPTSTPRAGASTGSRR
ncbi:MAG: hypothetical protein ACRDWY_06035, partial [Actinomycetes bacterium]